LVGFEMCWLVWRTTNDMAGILVAMNAHCPPMKAQAVLSLVI
jgi:hypothetical protein